MIIFKKYTGNALLNNALMTVEALGGLENVAEVTPGILKELYFKVGLKSLNKRLKSYTMVFSLNNPLVNPAKKANNAGEETYHHLLLSILDQFENSGRFICEISGLRFDTTFEMFYEAEINRQKDLLKAKGLDPKVLAKEIKNLESTDFSLNRSWFPLIGGLGSDAQALPQAKYTIQIHPICLVILQFLPLSALLYKGGVLLLDSSNFQLSKRLISKNVQTLKEKIQLVSIEDQVENVRDFSKGDYLLKALDILEEKELLEEKYSDLNLWSFSNSGTGASCSIDRVPNGLIRKLQTFYKNPELKLEFNRILSNNDLSYRFVESLSANIEWPLLYPTVFGSGKKAVSYNGVSPKFLETYFEVISKSTYVSISKYIAGLIKKYQSKSFEKILAKTDAWKEPEYRIELFSVFIEASKNDEWTLNHHISILDSIDNLPIKNTYYHIHKLVHYFYQKNIFSDNLPDVEVSSSQVYRCCSWLINMIKISDKSKTTINNLKNPNENAKVSHKNTIINSIDKLDIELNDIYPIFYDSNFFYKKNGTNDLLRIYFSRKTEVQIEESSIFSNQIDEFIKNWLSKREEFVDHYQVYFFSRYGDLEEGRIPLVRYNKSIHSILNDEDNFSRILKEIINSENDFLEEKRGVNSDYWNFDELMTDPSGNSNFSFSTFCLKFLLKKSAAKLLTQKVN